MRNRNKKEKIIVILGPTASGKSDLAIRLASRLAPLDSARDRHSKPSKNKLSKYKGAEIISADSRQVYRGMDLGSGKVPISYERSESTKLSIPPLGGVPKYRDVPHHLLDVSSPKRQFSVSRYQKLAQKALQGILKRNKLPIICGGTGFYIDSLIYNIQFPNIKPDLKLRKELEKLSTESLFQKLKKLDPKKAESIDPKNPRRLVRAIEIALSPLKKLDSPSIKSKEISPLSLFGRNDNGTKYAIIKIGIKKSLPELEKRIEKRLETRLKKGMIKEVENLKKSGLSWKRLESFGLEYKYIAQYLQKKISKTEMKESIKIASRQYAKRQLTWWKKDEDIYWVENDKEAERLARGFLN